MFKSLSSGSGLLVAISLVLLGCGGGGGMNGPGAGGSTDIGTGGALAGTGGAVVGTGGAIVGTGGAIVGTGGVMVGTGGAIVGTGGAMVGTGGAIVGTGGAAGGDGGAVGGAGGAVGGAGGAVGGSTGGCETNLTGTWDMIATSENGDPSSGVLVIGADTFSVTVTMPRYWTDTPSTTQLIYSAAGNKTLTWTRTDEPVLPIQVQNTPAALDTGSIPLALGGQWVFSANQMRCSATVGTTSTFLCQNNPTGRPGVGDWPYPIPEPMLGATYTVTQTSQLASQFGFLGGQWQARSNLSPETCTMKVDGATVTISCRTENSLNGSLQITLGSGCVASGLTSTGYELSARRR